MLAPAISCSRTSLDDSTAELASTTGGSSGSGGYLSTGGGETGAGGAIASGGQSGSGAGETGGIPSTGGRIGTGGVQTTGGESGLGGSIAAGGRSGTGGITATGGSVSTGGRVGIGGSGGVGTGGRIATGGVPATGGPPATGGAFANGGTLGSSGGVGTGGLIAAGGLPTTGGTPGTGGAVATGGTFGTGGGIETGGAMSFGGIAATGGIATSGGANDAGGTSGAGGSVGTCGDGVVEPPEQCDLGSGNTLRPAFLVMQNGPSFAATPVMRVASGANFYDYASSSAHTGFEAVSTSRVFLYLDETSTILNLFVIHGVDATTTRQQGSGQVQMLFSGLPSTTTVAVSDDSGEFKMTSTTTATGKWSFSGNTDGGVLTGLTFPGNWDVLISPAFLSGITTWTWVEGDSSFVALDLTQPLNIKAYDSPSACRPDCTVPRCGDGILDGGEICDDGNTTSGDGCAGDCKSLD